MNSVEILKSIYKPYRYTIKGKVTLLETSSGDFIIKPKTKDIRELYNYLLSRNFDSFPKLVDGTRSEVNLYEYIPDIKMPKEQKCSDLIDTLASLHNKTSYYKEVTEDNYKEIYESIKSNINYLNNYYNTLYDIGFNEVYMSPSTYLLMRNYSKIKSALSFCEKELDNWYQLIKGETKTRVAIVHNNLSLNHFIENNGNYLISWDNYVVDTPIKDLVILYKKEYLNMNFQDILARYLIKYPLLEAEKKLLFILITLPPEIKESNNEFDKCINIGNVIDYVFKTEELIGPYYSKKEEIK